MPVFDTSVGRLGTVICWENYMPLLRMSMYAKGIQVWCAPTADSRDTWIASMRHIACEGRCFVLSANQFVRRSDYPDDYPIGEVHHPDDVLCRGASVIVSPLGEILAGPAVEGEEILIADIDLDEIVEAKYHFDVVGHYARPYVFKLVVNEASTPAVVTTTTQEDLAITPHEHPEDWLLYTTDAADDLVGWRSRGGADE